MKVSEIGEFGLIDIIARAVAEMKKHHRPVSRGSFKLLEGIGDDGAVWHVSRANEVATTDTMVEGVHFALETATWRELGWKALAVNISDIAAMGGFPKYALVTLGLPKDAEVESILELYQGMMDAANRYDVEVAGGDMVGAPQVIITVALTGYIPGSRPYPQGALRRSGAKAGDLIAVTGHLGSAAGGLMAMKLGLEVPKEAGDFLRASHLMPTPRVEEGRLLARSGVRAAIDVSDGLLGDLQKLCRASGVAAEIQTTKVPIHPLLKAAFPHNWLDLALSGGEDYELLFTAPSQMVGQIKKLSLTPISVIGSVLEGEPGQVVVIDETGSRWKGKSEGWDHLALGGEGA